MARLAGYARDDRLSVQKELLDAWLHFDPQRYAEEVLADAPLERGYAKIESARLIPHLSHLRHLAGTDAILASHEVLPDLSFVDLLKELRSLKSKVSGEVDLSLLTATAPRMIYLTGAQRFMNLDRLPSIKESLGLYQREPWVSLDFLRGRALQSLQLSAVSSDCDLSPIAEIAGLRSLVCTRWPNLGALPPLPELDFVFFGGGKDFRIDLRPLKGRRLRLELHRLNTHIGLDELGPDVTINWIH
jgi:hypothetical protein